MIQRRANRSFLSYIDLSREYYAAHGYTKPYQWISHQNVPFAKLEKPLSECRVALLTTTDLEKLLHPQGRTKLNPYRTRN